MALKKSHIVISAFIIFWILFISWGMFKTSVKLAQEKNKTAAKQTPPPTTSKKPEDSAPKTGLNIFAPKKSEAPPQKTTLNTTPDEPKAVINLTQVRTLRIKETNFTDLLPVMGTVKGETEIGLRFEINGLIKKIYFREGQKVMTGDTIACIETKDLELKASYGRNKYNSAKASYNSALKKLEIHKKLYETGAIIKSKMEEVELESESARYQAETARSEMELAENELTKTCMRATKDGVIGLREAEEGEFVTPQDKVLSLFEIKNVFVEVGIVERDIDKIKLGQKAKIYVDAYPNKTFEGIVESIFPVVEGKSRTLTIKIKVPNPESELLPGMFSRAEMLLIELKGAIMVPSTALVQAGADNILLPVIPQATLEKDAEGAQIGIVELRRIKLGYITTDYAQVVDGLKPEDLVVIETQGELKDGIKVKIIGSEELSL